MRILVVRIGRAGDIVMTTPAISALIKCYPTAEITILTSPDGKRLFKNFHSNITELLVWDRSKLIAGLHKVTLKKTIEQMDLDHIFCFETSASIAALFDGCKARLHLPVPTPEITHSARLYLNMVKISCDIDADSFYATLPVSSRAASDLRTEFNRIGIKDDDIVIALHPTFSGYSRLPFVKSKARKNKLWPTKSFSDLALKLSETVLKNGKLPYVIIDLLASEAALGKEIVKLSNGKIILLTEPPNMERYKALLERVDLLVSPDTGPMHIAAAVNTKIVALFSGKSPDDCGPYMPADRFKIIQAKDMKTPQNGISAISVEPVYNACLELLNKPD